MRTIFAIIIISTILASCTKEEQDQIAEQQGVSVKVRIRETTFTNTHTYSTVSTVFVTK